jgi:hypothetical protein
MLATAFGVALTAIITAVDAVPTISTKGAKFFTSEGNQFFVKGAFLNIYQSHS